MALSIEWALLIWFVLLVVIYILARRYDIQGWSAFILALLISTLLLVVIRPPNAMGPSPGAGQNMLLVSLYWLILFVSPIFFIIYIVGKAVTDRKPPRRWPG